MTRPRAGPQGASSSATGSRSSATCRRGRTRWPGSSGSRSGPRCCGAPPDDTDPVERVVVANADQLVVVTALADPEPRPRLIDRCLVAAYDGGLTAAAVPDQDRPGRPGRAARRSTPARRRRGRHRRGGSGGWTELRERLRGPGQRARSASPASASRRWSTRSVPDAHRAIGEVNARDRPGPAHLDLAVALPLPGGGGWVDRHPGRAQLRARRTSTRPGCSHAFPDLAAAAERCPPGCDHPTTPSARWTTWVAAGHAEPPGSTRCAGCSRPRTGGDEA